MDDVIKIIVENRDALASGLFVTLRLCLIVWGTGLAFGVLLGIITARWPRAAGWPVGFLSMVVAAVPAIVLMFWLHYPAQHALGIVVDPFVTSAVALSVINVLLVAQLVRGQLADFPRQYVWAAWVAGMTKTRTTVRIMLPMLIRLMLPGILQIQIGMLQATIFASLISVPEVFRICLRINASIHQPVEVFTALAVFFVLICLPLHLLVVLLKRRFVVVVEE